MLAFSLLEVVQRLLARARRRRESLVLPRGIRSVYIQTIHQYVRL